jgi:phage antirepressor YoqD-like protein
MNAIVNITADITMTSLELVDVINELRQVGDAEMLHKNFMVKLEKHPGIDSAKFLAQYKDSTGRTLKCYRLPKRESELMVMSESLAVQTKVYDRMTALEEKAAKPAFAIPQSFTEALRLAADLAEGKAIAEQDAAQKQKLLELAAPKVQAFELISASAGAITMTETAKVLSRKQADLAARMHAEGWIYRQNGSWVAYKQFIDNGCLEYKEAKYTDTTGIEVRKPYCHVTPKGVTKLALMLAH